MCRAVANINMDTCVAGPILVPKASPVMKVKIYLCCGAHPCSIGQPSMEVTKGILQQFCISSGTFIIRLMSVFSEDALRCHSKPRIIPLREIEGRLKISKATP